MAEISASSPSPVEDVQGDGRWLSLHQCFIADANEREPEVLFVGDSLVQQLALTGLWQRQFVPLHSLNFGIGGDQTQHVLWRLENGELEGMSPKVVVVLVGTNNHGHSAAQIADGIEAIVKTINKKQPQAIVIVMGLPPRGQYANPLREKLERLNELLADRIPSLPNAQFWPADASLFVNAVDGSISRADMHDFLHFTDAGYQKFVEPLLEEIQTLLKNFMTADTLSLGDADS